MTTRALIRFALSSMLLGGAVVAATDVVASSPDNAATARIAATQAGKAADALAEGKSDAAVRFAEAAVAGCPRIADYRVLLGQSYLKAGRFTSARAAFADALALEPGNAKAALNLALVETGLGDWAGARDVLAHADAVPAADRGLATALAGDPAGALEILSAATRSPDATVKTRQNLALAMALAGRWPEARMVAAMDLSPADLDARLEQWAAFAHPTGAADQVAALLGVTPVMDAGEPVGLALASAPARVAEAVPAAVPVAAVAPEPVAPTPVAAAAPAPAPAIAGVTFAAPSPVVQSLSAAALMPVRQVRVAAASTPYKVALKTSVAHAKGDWFVQIGAYRNAAVAHVDWARATHRDAAFRAFAPQGMTFQARGAQVYRVSVGGFARAEASALCRAFQGKGGRCFVRQGAGEQMASWVRRDVQLAAR